MTSPLKPEERAEMIRLYTAEGLSTTRIGYLLNRSGSTVYNVLKEANVKLRPSMFKLNGWRGHKLNTASAAQSWRQMAERTGLIPALPSIINFPPRLQAVFEAECAKVKRERGR